MLRRMTAALACATLLAGCSGSPSSSPSADTSPSASASASLTPSRAATPAVVPRAPRAKACYRLTAAQLTKPTNASTPVPCASRHTAQTIYVGTLDTVVDGHSVAVDSATVQKQLSTHLPPQARGVRRGVGDRARPEPLQRGLVQPHARAVRPGRGLVPLRRHRVRRRRTSWRRCPAPRGSRACWDSAAALDEFGLCGTSAPGAQRLPAGDLRPRPLLAGGRHDRPVRRRAVPRHGAVRKAGDSDCKDLAQARSGNALKYRYGWEWPTREQWDRGQRFGYCWVPD